MTPVIIRSSGTSGRACSPAMVAALCDADSVRVIESDMTSLDPPHVRAHFLIHTEQSEPTEGTTS